MSCMIKRMAANGEGLICSHNYDIATCEAYNQQPRLFNLKGEGCMVWDQVYIKMTFYVLGIYL